MAEPADLTALELLGLFREGQLSPAEAAQSVLARIETRNSALNAYCLTDAEATLAAARESEARYHEGAPKGLLDGVPVAIKDVFLTRGWPTLRGSRLITPDQPWEADAPAVAALRRHGAVMVGKTTTPELGWKAVTDSPLCGVTVNPWDAALTAGGSSGGSAAAVAAGMGPLALGTDAGGSIRIPAGFCSILGFKPTHGRVPMWPASPFGQLAHPGPMCWTAKDAALLMDVISEPDARDPMLPPPVGMLRDEVEKGVDGFRIAYAPNLGGTRPAPDIAALVAAVPAVFEELGARAEEVDPRITDPLEEFSTLFFAGAANALRNIGVQDRARMDPGLVEAAEAAERLTMLDYLAAANIRAALTEHMALFHEDWDLLITPTLPIAAFAAGREVPEGWAKRRWPSWTPFTYPFNLTGQPACSVPCGLTPDGLPVGFQLIGARHRDDLVLRAAAAYQEARPASIQRPPVG
ncbi:MAG TPA: amidase [Alphaproteobacteria bacterium]|nr:amidase [Alphaproteobacteria bacterium]